LYFISIPAWFQSSWTPATESTKRPATRIFDEAYAGKPAPVDDVLVWAAVVPVPDTVLVEFVVDKVLRVTEPELVAMFVPVSVLVSVPVSAPVSVLVPLVITGPGPPVIPEGSIFGKVSTVPSELLVQSQILVYS
jgi:hypothetical protein